MSTASAKDHLNEAAANTRSAASDLTTAAERNAKGLTSSAERNARDLRSKAEANVNSLRAQADSWKNTAEADAQAWLSSAEKEANKAESKAKSWFWSTKSDAESKAKGAEKEAKSWFNSTKSEAESKAKGAEKEAKSWFSSAEKEANKAESNAKSWFSSAEKDAKSYKDSAEKEAKSWGKSAESEAKSWANTAEAKAESIKDQAESGWKNLSKEAQNTASSLKSSAEKAAKDAKSYVPGIATASVTNPNAWVPVYSPSDYARFFAAGALCATITHGAMTPVDVVKTRLQLEPKGSKLNMVSMARSIVASEGVSGLMTGFGPTAVGYLIQGGSKFCGFEFFKQKFATMAGSQTVAQNNRTLIYMGAASSAELIASTLLTPLEAARIRLVSSRSYANGLVGAVTRMAKEGGIREFYAGYFVILLKQIPFTMAQFTINEYMHELFRKRFNQEKLGKVAEVGVSLSCGLVAGIGAAIASHPADTLLSKINKGEGGKGGQISKIVNVAQSTGFAGLWAGLGARMVMQALLICAQMGIYDAIKKGLDAPPAVTIDKVEVST